MARITTVATALALVIAGSAAAENRAPADGDAQARAAATVKAMRPDEKTVLTHGIMAMPFFPGATLPADAIPAAGYVTGLPRLGVPALRETDASLGVAWIGGVRKDGATPLPAGLAAASSWNPELVRAAGAMIGSEARAKGFNVMLAGGADLIRDPRNGRDFEYLSEDPWLTGTLAGAAIAGIQSNHIISTIKHYALNDQETGRNFVDIHIGEPAARESDLLAFEIGIERGHPGSVMCAYNLVNGHHACDSDWLLNTVLKRDWRYPGFVMSDWGAVPSLSAAMNGLDQQSGATLDPQVFFGKPLAEAAAHDPAMAARLDDMNRRIIGAIYAAGLDRDPATPGGHIDFAADGAVALEEARQGIVLLRNQGHVLPLAANARSIAVIGGYADSGVISGGGSSQVDTPDGPAVRVPLGGEGPITQFLQQHYHPGAPLDAIKAAAPGAEVHFRDGNYVAEAVTAARKADIAIVFATAWRSEGEDVPDLSLPHGQDALIAAVAAANPHTIVVLETGGPVAMPWLDATAAVIEAWYPGARGGQAIADVLFGKVDPSGRLPVTFPASLDQLPRPRIAGMGEIESGIAPVAPRGLRLTEDYDIEGADVGYRWFASRHLQPLFPFGFGLSYTSFTGDGLALAGLEARFTLRNTGTVAGADVAQLYLVSRAGVPSQRLVGYARVALAPGASQPVRLTIDPRLLADWRDGGWTMPGGGYVFALGDDASRLGTPVTIRLAGRRWREP
ncbi:MAG: glycoside hydrolase family 3 C-terminal domain-containing protein [Sphingomonadales bacterium]|nr:glycoside hydrolase family 3 C-terminal domain-containing protein [Sphingomonadales bacterium]